jgi:hypothetical protein
MPVVKSLFAFLVTFIVVPAMLLIFYTTGMCELCPFSAGSFSSRILPYSKADGFECWWIKLNYKLIVLGKLCLLLIYTLR